MSTYLVAFVVGELGWNNYDARAKPFSLPHAEYVEGKTTEGVVVRTYTLPGLKHEARDAMMMQ